MIAFANLLDRLTLTPARNGKLRLLRDYFADTPDPDRGLAVAAISRDLKIPNVKPALLRTLIEERMDAELFALSYDYVGDMAETISLVWTGNASAHMPSKSLGEVVALLQNTSRATAPERVKTLLDEMDKDARWALLKLITGGLRIGVSSRLLKQALADFGSQDITEIEELWHGLEIPYRDLFRWLEHKSNKPVCTAAALFRPVMLAHPLKKKEFDQITPQSHAAEWKWDGIRIQLASEKGTVRLYSRNGDEISSSFPDIVSAVDFEAVLDGELLVKTTKRSQNNTLTASSFGDLQQRLNRKSVTKKQLESFPAFIRAYDILQEGTINLRNLPFSARRIRLESLANHLDQSRFDLSPLVHFDTFDTLSAYQKAPPESVIEGLMIKRWDAPYLAGRPKGLWYKWKKDPHLIDAVLLYAQRGHGKRSSFYSDYTFGVWTKIDAKTVLVPVGKAYFGFTDAELKEIDKFVRENTSERFGPVRAVHAHADKGLVFEIAFEGLNRSTRHKSGVAMRFPRISRLRWDKKPVDADWLCTLNTFLPPGGQ